MLTQPNKSVELESRFPHIAWLISKGQLETLAILRGIIEADLRYVGDGYELHRLQCAINDVSRAHLSTEETDALLEALKP